MILFSFSSPKVSFRRLAEWSVSVPRRSIDGEIRGRKSKKNEYDKFMQAAEEANGAKSPASLVLAG